LLIGGVAAFARSETPVHTAGAKFTKESIVGAWRLIRIDYAGPNGPLPDPVFGPNPQGIIIYDSSGWMSVQIVTANRPTMTGPATRTSGEVSTDDAKLAAQAFNTYYAYFGSWEFDAATSVITHHLKASLLPYETGVEYRREVTFDGINLKLIVQSQQGNETRQRTLVWTRVSDSRLAVPSGSPLAGSQGTRTGDPAPPVTQTEPSPPTPVADTKYGDMPTNYEEAVRKYFQEHLKYPDSVQYQSIALPEQGYTTSVTGAILMREKREYGWTVKATINAKNAQNLYGGLKTYTFLFRGAKIIDVRLPLSANEMK
jgi:hypothetical protein